MSTAGPRMTRCAVTGPVAALLLWTILTGPAAAATVWDEALNGDLSNNGLSPTPVAMASGHNVVLGTTGNQGAGVDRDYFTFTVPAGNALTSLTLLPNTSVSGAVSFIAIQPGPQLTVTPTGGGVEKLIALGHYGNDQIGTDLLPSIAVGTYPGSLAAGTYSVWVQDTGGIATYGFDFVLTPLPAAAAPTGTDGPVPPWAAGALAAALSAVAWRRLRPPAD